MKDMQKNVAVLALITAISVLFLALIKEATKMDYERTVQIEENKTRKNIFPEADSFQVIQIDGAEAHSVVKNGKVMAIVVKGSNPKGFGGIVEVAVGVDVDGPNRGKIRGFEILKHNETPGLGTKAKEDWFRNPFSGKTLATLPEGSSDFKKRLGIDTITGATITSLAVLNAVKSALKLAEVYLKSHPPAAVTPASPAQTPAPQGQVRPPQPQPVPQQPPAQANTPAAPAAGR